VRLAGLPRRALGVWPTPLQRAERLSEELGASIWIKRDDLSGLGLGGNKVRKLEYLVADALERGADVLVTGGGRQSNHAALTSLAARKAGLDAHLVFYGDDPGGPPEGNGVLNDLSDAAITYTKDDERSSVDAALEEVAARLRDEGRNPYVIPRGGATPLGCAGYVRASLELAGQLTTAELTPSLIVVATGSCGTQAGLAVGRRWLQAPYRVLGVTVSRPAAECAERISSLGAACAELLDLAIGAVEGEVIDGYLGPGYGLESPEGRAAAELVARTEGLVLDPVFTAKAMAALLDIVRAGTGGPVVFWHCGGAPTAFVPRAGA